MPYSLLKSKSVSIFLFEQLEKPSSPGEANKKEDPRTESTIEREQRRETGVEGQDPQFAIRKPSPTSPTRPVWAPKDADHRRGQRADQASGPSAPQTRPSDSRQVRQDDREARAHEGEGARWETQDQFTDLSEAPGTPDTLTSEQEEVGDVPHDREAQQQQDHHHHQHHHQRQQGGEATEDESHEQGDLHGDSSAGETAREQEQESGQFQELVVPEQEVLEGHHIMAQEQEAL